MKKKISKILGVGLTLALLVSLMVAAVPAAASNLLYSTVSTPSQIGKVLLGGNDVDFLAAAADGTTMFAYDNTAKILYKSTDAGVTWTITSIGTGLNTNTIVGMVVSPKYATDSTVVAATTTKVYISVDGGKTFNEGPAITLGGGTISSVDLGSYYATNVVNVLVGLTGSAGLTSNVLRFPLSGAYAWSNVGALNDNVLAVAFSPQHPVDAEILAVSTNATTGNTHLNTQFGTAAWDVNIARTNIFAAPALATGAVIAFGSDYIGTGTNTILVGTRGLATDDVFRVSGLTMGAIATTVKDTDVAAGVDVQSIVITGPIATASVLVGLVGDVNVYRSTTVTATTITWTGSTSDPTGTTPVMLWAGGAAYAGTTGNDSALSKSTDSGVNFSQVALIDVGTIANMSITGSAIVDANTMFVIMANTTGGYAPSSLFKTTNGGTSWQRVLTATPALTIVKASPNYATDSTLYLSDGSMTLKKSIDGGTSFTAVGVPAAVLALAVVDKDTYFAGAAAALYKSGRWATATGLTENVKSIALSPSYATDKTLLVGNDDGDVFISKDDAVTFTKVGADDSLGNGKTVVVCLDSLFATNKTIYAAQSTDNATAIKRTTDTTTTTTWTAIDTNSSNKINGLAVDTSSNVLYAASGTANEGIRRSIDPLTAVTTVAPITAPTFQSMAAADPYKLGAGAVMKNLTVLSGKTPVLYAITSGMADATTPWGYTDRILTVTDTLTIVPTLTSPVMGTTLTTTTKASLAWTAVTGAISYDVWYGTDSTFVSTTVTTTKVTSTTASYSPADLSEGKTYYWKVRVATPVQSQWAVYLTFITALSAPSLPTVTLSPAPGAAGVSVTPALVWPAITGASSYDIQITDDPFFVTILSDYASLTNTCVITKPLAYSTSYYWRVKALSSTSESVWTTSTFTTMAEPAPEVGQYVCPIDGLRFNTQAELEAHQAAAHPPTAVTYTCPQCGLSYSTQAALQAHWNATHAPQPAEPAIPSYLLWTIIGIGAILVIALIVLIVRTRRVA